MRKDVAVVGLSCVFPGAASADAFWSNNVNGVSAIGEIPEGRWPNVDFSRLPLEHDTRMACTRGGFLPSGSTIDPKRYGLMPNLVRSGDPDQFLMTAVTHNALRDAQIADDDPIRARTDVIVGRGGYMSVKMAETFLKVDLVSRIIPVLRERFPEMGPREAADLEAMLHDTLPKSDPESYVTCIPNLVASRVSNRLNLRGTAYVVDAACASSLVAVEQAVDRLRNRLCDVAVAGAMHVCQTPSFWFVFTQLRALSASGMIRPFDRRADGLLIGEGAGAVILKRLEDAYRDGDRIYAIIKGVGSASDGRDTGVLLPSPRGQIAALEQAYADAGVEPRSISLLEAHGTGTVAGDAAETETIKRFYGTCSAPTRVMGSVKSMIGHAMPAAGMASLVRTILALKNKVLPPTINCEEPREELKDSWFYVLDKARPWVHPTDGEPRRAGINSFGFGGINAHVILEEVPDVNPVAAGVPCTRPFRDVRDRAAEPVLFSAPTREELLASLRQLADFMAGDSSDFTLEDVAFSRLETIDFDHPVKLVLICRNLDELREMVADSIDKLDEGQDPSGDEEHVHFSAQAGQPRGKVAMMFPGMAFPGLIGNFPSHMLGLCLHFPELRSALDQFEGKDGSPEDPIPFSSILSPPRSFDPKQRDLLAERVAPPKSVRDEQAVKKIKPSERNMAGTGTTLSNWMGWKLLEGLNVRPEMVCGQSAGDLTAMAVAGVLDFERDVIPKLWDGLSMPPRYLTRGCLAFVSGSLDKIQPYLADKPNTYLAIDVSPEAVLLGGAFDEIDRICEELRKDEIMAIGLPYLPGHTPRMAYLEEELVYAVDDNKILGPPQIPAYSALTADLFPDGRQEIRKLLMANLAQPVLFWQTIRRLHEDGARVFVQAGCGTLAANVETIVSDPEAVSVAVDVETRDPIVQLSVMVGMLFAAGVRFDPSFVFKHRCPRQLRFDRPEAAKKEPGHEMPLPLGWPFYSPEKDPTENWPVEGAALEGANDLSQTGLPSPRSPGKGLGVQNVLPSPHLRGEGSGVRGPETGSQETAEPVSPTPESAAYPVSRMPFAQGIVHFVPQEEIAIERTLTLDEDLYLADHHFFNAASVKPLEHCMPVLPMVMMIEAMSEAAAHLAPGAGLIGVEDVRATRWVDLENNPRPTIRIEGRLASLDDQTGVHYVQTEIFSDGQSCASATILLAKEYRRDLRMVFPELQAPGPWPITAEELYRDGHTFHGPRFQTVSAMDVLADNGLAARMRVLSKDDLFASQPEPELLTDPAVIDGAGQLLGSWSQTRGGYVLPVAIDKLELYGPTPPPGTEVSLRMEITRFDLDGNTVTADMEILDGEGHVWMRIRGWRDRVFIKESRFMEVQRAPQRRCFSDRKTLPGLPPDTVCTEITDDHLDTGALSWIAGVHLTVEEIDHLKRMIGRRRSQFLLGRIAVKDAVRQWLAEQLRSAEMIHPAAISIGRRESGQPFVEPIPGVERLPEISLSHTDGRTVALAASAPVGIDVEPLSRKTDEILDDFATPDEARTIRALSDKEPSEAWPTRLWCAKESVSKALGTGLGGQLRDFELVQVQPDGRLWIQHRPSSCQMVATTLRDEEMILAYTVGMGADQRPVPSSQAAPGETRTG